jgi:glycosyltransferase involved in cell wall biosynthesis
MKTTLVISTYNWPEALDLSLRSVAKQVAMPDEVIVTDDGSRPDTAELVRQWQARLPTPLLHVWQEDLGFRLARARNNAIAVATGDYLIFVDGDMVLHRRFVSDHQRMARSDSFIQGMRVAADAKLSLRMLAEKTTAPGFFAAGLTDRKFLLRSHLLSLLEYRPTTSLRRMAGCNQAYWRDHLIQVNGFNEEMVGWGLEDDELAVRMLNRGYLRRLLKFAANAVHLDHPRRKPEGVNPSQRILAETLAQRATWCRQGLDAHLGARAA